MAYLVIGVQTLSYDTRLQPGPALYPTIVACIAIVGSLGLVVSPNRSATVEGDQPEPWPKGADAVRLLIVMAAVGVYCVLMGLLGFAASTALLAFLLLQLLAPGRIVRNAITAVIYAITTYLLFSVALSVALPRGWLI